MQLLIRLEQKDSLAFLSREFKQLPWCVCVSVCVCANACVLVCVCGVEHRAYMYLVLDRCSAGSRMHSLGAEPLRWRCIAHSLERWAGPGCPGSLEPGAPGSRALGPCVPVLGSVSPWVSGSGPRALVPGSLDPRTEPWDIVPA
jgi:hypothetical protein